MECQNEVMEARERMMADPMLWGPTCILAEPELVNLGMDGARKQKSAGKCIRSRKINKRAAAKHERKKKEKDSSHIYFVLTVTKEKKSTRRLPWRGCCWPTRRNLQTPEE